MLVVSGLVKRYGTNLAVDDVFFSVPSGSSFGLLGPNGAGKTTTISMIVGTVEPDQGEVTLDGIRMSANSSEAKRKIGYVPQELALYEALSARANLSFFGALYGLFGNELRHAIDRVLVVVGLAERSEEPVKDFSGGMKRRLNIAVGLLNDPELIILDEPTVGVDPQTRNAIFECLTILCDEGKTILYTTHYMEEVERLCRNAVIMDHGRVIAEGDLASLQKLQSTKSVVELELDGDFDQKLSAIPGVSSYRQEGNKLVLELPDFGPSFANAIQWLSDQGVSIRSVQSERTSLEHVFLDLTGRSLRD